MGRIKIEVNSLTNIEAVLQETYDDAVRLMRQAEEKISELKSSTTLSNEPMDAKVKYSKAVHDFMCDKQNAIKQKLLISKILSDIAKARKEEEKESQIEEDAGLGNLLDELKNGVNSKSGSSKNTKTKNNGVTILEVNNF